MKLLDDYLVLHKQIIRNFDLGSSFDKIAIVDYRDHFWFITDDGAIYNYLISSPFSLKLEDTFEKGIVHYGLIVIVYRSEEVTLMSVSIESEDVGLNQRLLYIADNTKECRDLAVQKLIRQKLHI